MDIFRRLSGGFSKLSIHKKGSSKSKSRSRAYEATSDGLTYNSSFGVSFRHDPDDDPRFGRSSFVSPETAVTRSLEVLPEDFDGLEGSDSSFDRPFLDEASRDDLGDGSHLTSLKFRTYWKPVHARGDREPENEKQNEKSSSTIVKDSEVDDPESPSDNCQFEPVVSKSQQWIKASREPSDPTRANAISGTNEPGSIFQTEKASTQKSTGKGSNLLGTNLASLKSSIEELIDSGLRFQSPYYSVGLEPADEQKDRVRSKSLLHRHDGSDASNRNPKRAGWHGLDEPDSDAWNGADVDSHCVRKTASASGSLDSLSDRPGSSSDAERTDSISPTAGDQQSLLRRGSGLSGKKQISVLRSEPGSDSLAATETLEALPTKRKFPENHQLGTRKLSMARNSLERRPSELRNRRIAVMMCPRPYGYRGRVHANHLTLRGNSKSLQCSGEESEPIRPYNTTRQSELLTVSGLPNAGEEGCGDELRRLSCSESPSISSRAVNNPTSGEGSEAVESLTSVVSGRWSSEHVEESIQTRFSFNEVVQMKRADMSQRIFKTGVSEPRFGMQLVKPLPNLASSSMGGKITSHYLCESVHPNHTKQVEQAAKPGDIWCKEPVLDKMKPCEEVKVASAQSILTDELSLQVPPSKSSIAVTYPRPPSRDPPQPRSSQASATQENMLQFPSSFSASIFCSKAAILKQSRKGWSARSSGQDSD